MIGIAAILPGGIADWEVGLAFVVGGGALAIAGFSFCPLRSAGAVSCEDPTDHRLEHPLRNNRDLILAFRRSGGRRLGCQRTTGIKYESQDEMWRAMSLTALKARAAERIGRVHEQLAPELMRF